MKQFGDPKLSESMDSATTDLRTCCVVPVLIEWRPSPELTQHMVTIYVSQSKIRILLEHRDLMERGPTYQRFLDLAALHVMRAVAGRDSPGRDTPEIH